jgi:hypothetical protein
MEMALLSIASVLVFVVPGSPGNVLLSFSIKCPLIMFASLRIFPEDITGE